MLLAIGCTTSKTGPGQTDSAAAAAANQPTLDDSRPVANDWPATAVSPAAERARWRDVDAAVNAAAFEVGVAVERVEKPGAFERVYRLVGVRGEPGHLRVDSPPLPDPDDMTTIEPGSPSTVLECRIGRFGDPAREQLFIESLRAWRPRHRR